MGPIWIRDKWINYTAECQVTCAQDFPIGSLCWVCSTVSVILLSHREGVMSDKYNGKIVPVHATKVAQRESNVILFGMSCYAGLYGLWTEIFINIVYKSVETTDVRMEIPFFCYTTHYSSAVAV